MENLGSTQPDDKSRIFCTYCTDIPVAAVKSCVLCEASLCDKHLGVHSKSPEHVLCDPTTSLKNRKCPIHKKILEYYCTEDSACICVSCVLIGEHKGHPMESLNEASEKKNKKLKNVLQKLATGTEDMNQIFQRLQEHGRQVQNKAGQEKERVTALFRDLRRQLEDLEKRTVNEISRQAEQALSTVNNLIQQLQTKKDELSRKIHYIEELCNMTDPLTVLQESDTSGMYGTEDKDNKDREKYHKLLHDVGDLDVTVISHLLHTGLSNIITGFNKGIFIPEAADILLDVHTAGNLLRISEDRKTASVSVKQNYPKTAERFLCPNQVLSSQRFSSRRLYWEVEVGGSERWRVGMCYPSMARKGEQSWIGNNNKSWCLERWNDRYLLIHDGKWIQSPGTISSNKVRIYLDYEAGRLSFYDLCEPFCLLHTFTATFTEPLHASLWVGKGCTKICGWGRRNQDM